MLAIFTKIFTFDQSLIPTESSIGRCANCAQPVSIIEGELVEEFWTQIISQTDSDVYFELVLAVDDLNEDQFNLFHEPLLCLSCLRLGIHREIATESNADQPELRRVCAWCGKILNCNTLSTETPITHGICPECRQRLEYQWFEEKLRDKRTQRMGDNLSKGIYWNDT